MPTTLEWWGMEISAALLVTSALVLIFFGVMIYLAERQRTRADSVQKARNRSTRALLETLLEEGPAGRVQIRQALNQIPVTERNLDRLLVLELLGYIARKVDSNETFGNE